MLWLQTWARSGDGRALLLPLQSASLHILSPTEGEKIPGYDSRLRPTASVQIWKTDVVQGWGRRETRECVGVDVCACISPPFLTALLDISLCSVEPQTQNLLHSAQPLSYIPNNAHFSQPSPGSPWIQPTSPAPSLVICVENQALP